MQFRHRGECEHHHPKSYVVVPVVRFVPVAEGAARVPVIVVERAAAQNTKVLSARPHSIGLQPLTVSRLRRLLPAAQKTSNLGDHLCYMPVLAI
jgi:hypothetical protein